MSVTVTMDRSAEVIAAVQAFVKRDVLVGIPEDTNARKSDAMGNAAIGYVNENGSPANNIPARPFLLPGVLSVTGRCAAVLKHAALQAFTDDDAVNKGLESAGQIARDAVKKKITTGPFAPLSAMTISMRKADGISSVKPLIRTGQLRNSITYVVKDR